MAGQNSCILTVNAGSSSIKLALFEANNGLGLICEAAVEGIGQPEASLRVNGPAASDNLLKPVAAVDHKAATGLLTDWLKRQTSGQSMTAIGHRVVHGGPKFYKPTLVNDDMLVDLRKLEPFDPEHLPVEIALIETFQKLFPAVKQVACFDTAFHHDLPTVARLLPIPRHYEDRGIRRYGFHGLSYQYLMQELQRLDLADGRLILAHLGNGVSLAAVHGGKSLDTTMSLTPAGGVPMATRSGDIDPGLPLYLALNESLDAEQFNKMVNSQSGQLGISGTTSDMKQLLELEANDSRAKDAVDIFCYQIKKSIGGLAAGLGGLDCLVFTGGIGENAPKIRTRICEGLQFLGIELDEDNNASGRSLISTDKSKIVVRIVHASESSIIAQDILELINNTGDDQ